MNFLVLALCVCAASAATLVSKDTGVYKPWQQPIQTVVTESKVEAIAKAVVEPFIKPVQAVTKSVYTGKEAEAPVLRSESDVRPDGFSYSYETGNGISAQAAGALKTVYDTDTLEVEGAYRFQTPEGVTVEFTYVADENGFQPKSNAIPVGPATPEYIIRALEYIRTHPSKEQDKEFVKVQNLYQ